MSSIGKNKSLKFFLISFFTFLIFFSFSCTPKKKESTFVYCTEGSPRLFNPQLSSDGPSFEASGKTVYNRLITLDRKSLKLKPSLATSWEVSKDRLKIRFNLRKNVSFHKTKYFTPTRNFNADDVLFSINRMRKKNHPYHKVGGGTYEYFVAIGWSRLIKDIVKINDHQVEFILSYPNAPFLINLSGEPASILSKEYADFLLKQKRQSDIDFYPIGTGPFIFKSYLKDNLIRFKAHPNYFLGRTPIENMVFSITPDASVRFQKLKTGECHFIREPSPIDIESMMKHPKIKLTKKIGMNIAYIAFNIKKKPFDNILVRKAIYQALNRESYLQPIYLKYAEVAKNPIPPSTWGYNHSTKDLKYNVKKARELLKQAGYPNGFSTTLWTLPIARPYNPNGKKMGELIQADLAKIGIKVKIVTYKWATYLEKVSQHEHEMAQLGWSSDNGDPSNFLEVLLSCKGIQAGSNISNWCNKDFDQLINRASQVFDTKERSELYKKSQEIFRQYIPWIPIAHSVVFNAMRKKVIHFVPSSININSFYNVDFED